MKLSRSDWLFIIAIFFISIVTVFDLFTNVGRSANMDGLIHVTTAELYYRAMLHGQFPVTWVDGFGNYGFPLGLIAQQVTSYASAILIFIVHSPVTAYNIVCFVGLLLSNIFFYIFLRKYLPQIPAFVAVFLFNFSPYRIINLYIRGAIPEAFSNIFLPLILLSLYSYVKNRKITGLLAFSFLITCLALTHPMTLLIYSFIFVPYFLFLILVVDRRFIFSRLWTKQSILLTVGCILAAVLGLGMAGYYLVPLNLEIKYFYYGLLKNHLTENQYLELKNYFDPQWYYFTKTEIFSRGHVIKAGLVETLTVIFGVVTIVIGLVKKRSKYTITLFDFAVVISLVIIFFTTKYSDVFYQHINLLSQIQFPWRMFTAFMFLPPIIVGFFFKKFTNIYLILFFLLFICIIRFPQLYGKNYADYSQQSYDFTAYNLHSTAMNTIWTGKTEDYPIEKNKGAIIEGTGTILSKKINETTRLYDVDASTPLLLVDYTFYFPGWHVYVDGQNTPIQFQDPRYRGVITYNVTQGSHSVLVKFTDTKVGLLGKVLSAVSILLFIMFIIFRNKLQLVFIKNKQS